MRFVGLLATYQEARAEGFTEDLPSLEKMRTWIVTPHTKSEPRGERSSPQRGASISRGTKSASLLEG
jgi:hypothetical protein